MYQHKHHQLPRPLLAMHNLNIETHEHNTRHRQDPHITSRRTQKISKSFIHKAPEFWYTIPEVLKQARTVSAFKNKITRFLGY